MISQQHYRDSDEALRSFNLIMAARIVPNITVAQLRNYVARDVLWFAGSTPLAGQERRFQFAGLVEIALIAQMSHPFGVSLAAEVTHTAMTDALMAGYLKYCSDHPEVTNEPGMTPDEIRQRTAKHPEYWLAGAWSHDDLSDPRLLVFATDDNLTVYGTRIAEGYADIPVQRYLAINKHRFGDPARIPCFEHEVPRPVPTDLDSSFPLFHVLNLTATLESLAKGIESLGAPPRVEMI